MTRPSTLAPAPPAAAPDPGLPPSERPAAALDLLLRSLQRTQWLALICGALMSLVLGSAPGRARAAWVETSAHVPAAAGNGWSTGPLPRLRAGDVRIEPAGSPQPLRLEPAGRVGAGRLAIRGFGGLGGPGGPGGLGGMDDRGGMASIAQRAELLRLRAATDRPGPRGSTSSRSAGRAAWVLGLLYLHGIAVTQDGPQARAWFDRARSLGEPLASAGLAWCDVDGCGMPASPRSARAWLVSLRQVDAARAAFLEWLVEDRLAPLQPPATLQGGTLVPPPLHHRALLQRAAGGGNPHARIELGIDAASRQRFSEAAAQFRLAAPRSRAASSNLVLVQLQIRDRPPMGLFAARATRPAGAGRRNDTTVEPPEVPEVREPGEPPVPRPAPAPLASPVTVFPATTGLDNSVQIDGAGDSAGQSFASARRYHRGDGVPANYAEAIRLYRLADGKGSMEARRMLALIASRPDAAGQIDVAWMQQLAWLDVSGDLPRLEPAQGAGGLRREPTPLVDMLPDGWRPDPAAPGR